MSDKPQTTRNKIQGVYTENDAQVIFIDTPGIHKPKHKIRRLHGKDGANDIKKLILFCLWLMQLKDLVVVRNSSLRN